LEFNATSGSLLSPNLDFDEDLRLEDVLKEEELDLELFSEDIRILFKAEEIVESYRRAIFQCSGGKSSQVMRITGFPRYSRALHFRGT